MDANQNKRHRRSIRLQGFDYSQTGAYFVTICTRERACIFGEVIDGEMRLNNAGDVVDQCWLAIPRHFPDVDLDAYVVMPNHVHGIVVMTDRAVGAKNF
jgi:REP element-mobilizing transposase RayT